MFKDGVKLLKNLNQNCIIVYKSFIYKMDDN